MEARIYSENIEELDSFLGLFYLSINMTIMNVVKEHGITEKSLFTLFEKVEKIIEKAPVETLSMFVVHNYIKSTIEEKKKQEPKPDEYCSVMFTIYQN